MPKCPVCGSTHVVHHKWVLRATKPRIMQWQCMECGRYFQEPER